MNGELMCGTIKLQKGALFNKGIFVQGFAPNTHRCKRE